MRYIPISGVCIRVCQILSLAARGGEVCVFFRKSSLFQEPHFRLMDPGFGRPMQCLDGEVDQFRWLAPFVRENFSAVQL